MWAAISEATYPPFIFSLIVGIPSLILYIIEVFILLSNPSNFRSAFFRLFIVRSISNVFNYFCSYFYMRLGCLGLFIGLFKAMPSQLLAFFFFLNYYTFHADNLSTMFILLNRLTLIIFPVKHTKIWKYALPISILVTYSIPLICTVPVLTYDFFVRLQKDNETFTLAIVLKPMPNFFVASAQVSAVSGLLFGVICGMLNITTIILYRQATHTNVSIASSVEQKVESRLTMYAIVTFATQLSMAGYYILRYISAWLFQSDPDFFVSLANQFCWVHDMNTIVLPAWFLLWASTKVRERVCSLVLPRSWRVQDSVIYLERRSQQSSKASVGSKIGT